MNAYGVSDVEKLLRLPRATIRAFVAAGFVSPERGPGNALRFSFQDLIVLRTAQALIDAKVPQRRITQSVKELRRHLPDRMPLSGLSIGAVADRVVVREGGNRWQADSGQYLLAFEGDPADGSMSVVEPKAPAPATTSQDWYAQGAELEPGDPDAALRAYDRAIVEDPTRLDARINLGRLLHESGRLDEAERAYRDALAACGASAVILYNLGVLLQDAGRKADAVEAYEGALAADPGLADAHYNLALLYESLRKPKDAIRQMSQYRRLTGARRK
jgi:DNA-binding transcriptional MerR regulator